MKRINHKILNGIEVKRCSTCKNWLPLSNFTKQKDKCFGLRAQCKKCKKLADDIYNESHKNVKNAYYIANAEKIKVRGKVRYENNKKKILIANKQYRETHKKEHNTLNRKYYITHKKAINAHAKHRRKTDPMFSLNSRVRLAICKSLKGNKKGRHWEDVVGYTLVDLKRHLEKRFQDGMSWENYGLKGWTIDHKVPIAVFNFTKPGHRDFKRCWALKNLQPMWAGENMSKGAKITRHFQPSLAI